MNNKGNIVVDKSFEFALAIIKCYKHISSEKKEFTLSKQMLRSGTAIGALVREGVNAESKKDFIHKLAVAQKECDETLYWLELLERSNYLDQSFANDLKFNCEELLRIIRSIILTTKKRMDESN